jgi:hypothetical protein
MIVKGTSPPEALASLEAYISYTSLSLKQQKRTITQIMEKSTCKLTNQGATVQRRREKVHVSTGEWRIIMSVLMGYQYALYQRRKKLREEKDEFRRSQENNSVSSGAYWDEYSDASESSRERHRDPKHSRRTIAWTREESRIKSISAHQSEDEEDFMQETPEVALVAA